MRRRLLVLTAILFLAGVSRPATARRRPSSSGGELRAPAGSRPVQIDPAGAGETILPNGRLITPLGTQVKVAPHPYGLALSSDGKILVTANSGTNPFSVSIITELGSLPERSRRELAEGQAGAAPQVVQIPPGFKSSGADPDSVFLGVAIAPDNHTLYVSEGNNGRVGIFDLVSHQRLYSLSLDGTFQGKTYNNSLSGAMQLTPDGRNLLVLDLGHFRLVVIDTESKKVLSSTPVGRMPFGLALSPDGRRAYVSNVGMFQYSLVPGYDPKDAKRTGLDFPAFGFPSKESAEGVNVNGKQIPGLGDPNLPESNSVFVLDIYDPAQPSVIAKLRTGIPVGPQSVGGSSPGAVVAGRGKVFVSNANQDSITILSARTNQVEKTVVLEPAPSVKGLRGVLPFGMALSPDEKRLYVACAGINAIAVLDARKGKVLAYLPTAWFPARVALSPDGKTLYVACAKGLGAGPNGGANFHEGPEGAYIGDITKGTVSIFPVPGLPDLKRLTAQVLANNGFAPTSVADARAPYQPRTRRPKPHSDLNSRDLARSEPSDPASSSRAYGDERLAAGRAADSPVPPPGRASAKIRHVIFIIKENRTFDEVFGDIKEAGAEVEPSLARWGEDAEVKDEDEPAVEHVNVTPNHHALARRFAISDNFYVDSDVSVDGHHWLVGNYPNELIEASWPAAYGDRLDFRPDADAPGRLEIGGGGPAPEDYLEAGTIWDHLARHHITFRNYGEGIDLLGSQDGEGLQPTGIRESVNAPLPQALFENTSRAYPTFNTSISDQYRFEQFVNEFRVRYERGKVPFPQFMCLWLPNDHTAKPRPDDGYRYEASYVADNDLALGKFVDLLSHSPFWKDMAIFVTEDDAQDGRDHVDAHRSLLLVISPYARRGVSHVHTSMASILKTFFLILGLPYLNQYDAAATDLSDMFTDQPDLTPYEALPSDLRVFDPAKVREAGLELHARPSAPLDDPATIRREMREQGRGKDED